LSAAARIVTPLHQIEAYLVDLDGVLVRGAQILPGAVDFLKLLRSRQLPFRILTNNSTRTPAEYAAHLTRAGVDVAAHEVLTSAVVTASALAQQQPGARAFVVGSPALHAVLTQHGLVCTDDATRADVVVAGLDRELRYERLARAALAVQRGARFVATNADAAFPTERGLEPGAGAIVAALQTTTGVAPEVFGKPAPAMFLAGVEQVDRPAARVAIVGDRLDTDIEGGARAGLVTIAVATGVTSMAAFERHKPLPNHLFPSIHDLWRGLVC
jgi:4-nitrophenyl phosphatase